MPDPNRVDESDLYGILGEPSLGQKLAPARAAIADAVKNPQDADGWAGVLIPAVATAVALQAVRRFL